MKALVAIAVAVTLAACGDTYRYLKSGEVGWALKKELRDRHSSAVVIAKLTVFDWDEMFLFGPYSPTDEVCRQLNIAPAQCRSVIKAGSTDDGEMLMVFRKGGKVVHTELHIRWHGDFTPIDAGPFTPRTAVFAVSIEGKGALGEDWYKLRPLPAPHLSLQAA